MGNILFLQQNFPSLFNNLDNYRILQESDDHRIRIVIRILLENDKKILINIQIRKLDDYGILVKFKRDLDQNSFKELDDHGIFCKILQGF